VDLSILADEQWRNIATRRHIPSSNFIFQNGNMTKMITPKIAQPSTSGAGKTIRNASDQGPIFQNKL